ncbi:acyl-CoA dehydrogenase family protein [Microvirga antarctica]|uniref:acyl-CoA dehydrogenase family protein n=1 Tax=Microvirga antarctica TaxID=2819233 RepID=UPI001B30BF8B|nr:acyl-CoA dehydrogenase family protein [Microvirga antarctica]
MTPEQRALQDEARKIARSELAGKAAHWDATGEVPWENIRVLAANGYMGLVLPEEHGGSGANLLDLVIVLEELAWACVSTSLYVFSANAQGNRIVQLGTDDQRKRYVPRIAAGDFLASHAMSEPGAGSDARQLRTRAERRGDEYVVNGDKCWISRGAVADLFLVNVSFREEGKKGLLLVERGTDGLEIGKVEPLMGHRGSPSTELHFKDCRVPLNQRMSDGDLGSSLMSMSFSRCCNAAMALGAAQRAFEDAVDYIQTREAYSKPLADLQGLRWMVADMKVKLEAARLLIHRAAASAASGFPSESQAAVAKTFANEAALQVISDAMQLMGANGYSREYPIERLYRDARGFAIAGGTTQIQRNLIARSVLGRRVHAQG